MPPLSAEVDVFRVPHYRMKSLVNRSLRRYAEADFTDNLVPNSLLVHLRRLLEDIRTHESIEESLIMKQLVERVGGLPGPRPDCWAKLNDHTCVMPKIVDLVAEITLALASTSRKVDAKAVVGATYYLVHSVYLEHIVEEEGLIMSLLLDYFNPEELVQLKRVVVNEHARSMIGFSTACCEYGSGCVGNEISFDLDMRSAGGLPFESCEEAWACLEAAVGDLRPEDLKPKITVISCQRPESLDQLPSVALGRIFGFLPQPDLLSCARACPTLAQVAVSKGFWREIDASRFEPSALKTIVNGILPKVGRGVKRLAFRECEDLHSGLFAAVLAAAPNVEEVDFSFSPVGDECFEKLPGGSLCKLRVLQLTGCRGLTDYGLRLLAHHWNFKNRAFRKLQATDEGGLRELSLSGCDRVSTLDDLAAAKFAVRCLEYLDLSGCYALSGDSIDRFVKHCVMLRPENLFYCDGISDGPYADEANGCANLDDEKRFCCLSRTAEEF